MSKNRGKGLLNKAESMKEFATQTHIKYATCMDPMLEGDRLKPGEINNLCCSDDYEAITDFGSMSDKEKDEHIYALYGRVSKYKSNECMHKWLSFFIIVHKPILQAKAGRYLKLKKLKLDTWAEGVKLGRRADILSVLTLSALISKHTLIHFRNSNIWTTMETSKCVQTQNILSGTINSKHDITGTTTDFPDLIVALILRFLSLLSFLYVVDVFKN